MQDPNDVPIFRQKVCSLGDDSIFKGTSYKTAVMAFSRQTMIKLGLYLVFTEFFSQNKSKI